MSENLKGIERLLGVVRRLRGEGGCPWDREQTLESLKSCLIEESYEVIDAIDAGVMESHREELGDVLLQIVLQSRIREEKGDFGFDDVANMLAEKLIRRHPHVFGDVDADDSKKVLENWERIKFEEKGDENRSVVDGLPRHLPSLQTAQRVQSRVSRVGFDWTDVKDVVAKVDEELSEVKEAMADSSAERTEAEIGDLLFAVVNLSRFQGISAELALRKTIDKFMSRFREVERRVKGEGKELADSSLEEMGAHWEDIKKTSR